MNTDTERAERAEREVKEEQRILAANAWHLARYIIEHDIKIDGEFDAGQFLFWCEHYPRLAEEDKIAFANQYRKLEKSAKNVTARTLYATRIYGKGFFFALFRTSVGWYLFFLGLITMGFLWLTAAGVIELSSSKWVIKQYNAFGAAGLGTCVYLLRVTQQKLKSREFDPAYIPSHMIRLVLGVIAGGTIVLFPELYSEDSAVDLENINVGIGGSALAFVLGYAVDVFYAVLDRIGGKISGKPGLNANQ